MAMLDYASKLTIYPKDMIREDVERLREMGYSDRGILDINQIISYVAYVNRIADGLGVELEDLSEDQAKYIGVNKNGPFKPEYYRY